MTSSWTTKQTNFNRPFYVESLVTPLFFLQKVLIKLIKKSINSVLTNNTWYYDLF